LDWRLLCRWRLLDARLALLRFALDARLPPLRLPLPLEARFPLLPPLPLEARPPLPPPLPLEARLPLPLRALDGRDRVLGADPFPDEPLVRLRADCEDFGLWAI
jgi:hypothetical protein